MDSRFLMTLQVAVVGTQKIGAVPHGTRVTAPIASGHFEGPRLRGKVLPGGGDWTLLRADGVLELDLRLTLETDDGALIHMTSFGLRHGPPEVDRGARARRERRPLDLLLPDHASVRDRAPEVRVLESPRSPCRAAIGAPRAPSTRLTRSCEAHGRRRRDVLKLAAFATLAERAVAAPASR